MHFQSLEINWFDSESSFGIRIDPYSIFDEPIMRINLSDLQFGLAIILAHLHVGILQLFLQQFLMSLFNQHITIDGHLACDFLQNGTTDLSDLSDILFVLSSFDIVLSVQVAITSDQFIIDFISQNMQTLVFQVLNHFFCKLDLV